MLLPIPSNSLATSLFTFLLGSASISSQTTTQMLASLLTSKSLTLIRQLFRQATVLQLPGTAGPPGSCWSMLERRVRVVQVCVQVPIIHQNTRSRYAPEIAHFGQNVAKQEVSFRFANISRSFTGFGSCSMKVQFRSPRRKVVGTLKPLRCSESLGRICQCNFLVKAR